MKTIGHSDRRTFIGRVGAATAASIAAGYIGVEPLFRGSDSQIQGAQGSNQRANDCANRRREAAQDGLQNTPQNLQHPSNGDETLYPNKLGSYSKGLPHNGDGSGLKRVPFVGTGNQ